MDFEQEFEVIPVTRVKIADTEAVSYTHLFGYRKQSGGFDTC